MSKTQIEIISSRFIGDVLPKAMRSKRQKKILKTFKAHADNDGYLVDFFEKNLMLHNNATIMTKKILNYLAVRLSKSALLVLFSQTTAIDF